MEINLTEFMEDSVRGSISSEYTSYELFSVIIHSGSAHGGHYHAYIKDIDNLANPNMTQTVILF